MTMKTRKVCKESDFEDYGGGYYRYYDNVMLMRCYGHDDDDVDVFVDIDTWSNNKNNIKT